MKYLITIVFLAVSYMGFTQTDLDSLSKKNKFEVTTYYGDDSTMVRELINVDTHGKRHGTCYSFHTDGSLWGVANFKHGEKHGEWILYNTNGTIAGKYSFKKGKRTGRWSMYDINGDMVAERNY
jgi:antitoxin component YwqK of YwqJK toxin-antitoxin module